MAQTKSTFATEAGVTTTWLVSHTGCLPFKIVLFRMSQDYAKRQKIPDSVGLSVWAFHQEELTWKRLLDESDFNGDEVLDAEKKDCIVAFVLARIKAVFGMRVE